MTQNKIQHLDVAQPSLYHFLSPQLPPTIPAGTGRSSAVEATSGTPKPRLSLPDLPLPSSLAPHPPPLGFHANVSQLHRN
jgi:hypothetical protein